MRVLNTITTDKKQYGNFVIMKYLNFTISVLLMSFFSNDCYSQDKYYSYEMALQELETGYYYVAYDSVKINSGKKLLIRVADIDNNKLNSRIQIIKYKDTTLIYADTNGAIFYLDSIDTPLCIRISKPGTKYSDFYDCIHFWNKNEYQIPSELVIVLGIRNPGIITITSKRRMTLHDFQNLKDCILHKKYDKRIHEFIDYKKVIYY